jgi:hypothetical protein
MSYQPTHYPLIIEEYQASILDGELILYSALSEKVFYLNESSKLVWDLCTGKMTVEKIIDLLSGAYPEASATISIDVHKILGTLYDGGAILFSDSSV